MSTFESNNFAPMVFENLMILLEKEGEGFDEHEWTPYGEENNPYSKHCHTFEWSDAHDRRITFLYRLFEHKEPMCGMFEFLTDAKHIPTSSQKLFFKVIVAGGFHQMFYTDGNSSVVLGNFFYRSSPLRSELREYFNNQFIREVDPFVAASHVWDIFRGYSGLSGLISIFADLLEAEIFPRMIKIDPFCFDEFGTKYSTEDSFLGNACI